MMGKIVARNMSS